MVHEDDSNDLNWTVIYQTGLSKRLKVDGQKGKTQRSKGMKLNGLKEFKYTVGGQKLNG